MVNPRATNDDLTAKARIRNAALDLYAEHGADRVSLRAIASEAGVTLGLVQHHFKTKAGLREAVDQLVVGYFAAALHDVPEHTNPSELAAARDAAVRRMLDDNPPVVNYLRRALLEPTGERLHLLEALIELTRREIGALRQSRLASTERPESNQVVSVLIRQMGDLFLQPLIDAVWGYLDTPGADAKPRLRITVED